MIDPFELYVTDFVSEMNKKFRPKLEAADNKASLLVLDGIINFINDDETVNYVKHRRKLGLEQFLDRINSFALGEIGIGLGVISATDSYNDTELRKKIVEKLYKYFYT